MKNNTVVLAIVAVVITVVICATFVLLFSDADIAPLIGLLAPTIASLAALAQVTNVKKHTESLTNGLMDAKLRASQADVLPDASLDPTYVANQLDADRERRDSGV